MKESQFGISTVEEVIAAGGPAFAPPQQLRPKMAYELEEGNISVFVNDKGDNPKRPDYTGKCMVDGQELHISLWKSTSKNGLEYLSGRINPRYNGESGSTTSSASGDDVPW